MKERNHYSTAKKAVALTYHDNYMAPILTAKGIQETAEKIVALAKDHHIPIQNDAALVAMLSELDLGEAIPPELYQAVSEIFSFIYTMDKEIEK